MVCILMGVSGCGKTTVGRLLAVRLGLPFHDADDYHTAAAVGKMKNGIPLTDDDRMPWLHDLARLITVCNQRGGAVLACSALKDEYRRILSGNGAVDVRFVHLTGNRELIRKRLEARSGHYFPPDLLESQYALLEPPLDAIAVEVDASLEIICLNILNDFGIRKKMQYSDIGIFGLGVMGRNLALNLSGKGFCVSVHNRVDAGEEGVISTFTESCCSGKSVSGFPGMDEFVRSIARPRKIMLMIKAGSPVDEALDMLIPLLDAGDCVVDGGNSHYRDTVRRQKRMESAGLLYVGCGISGGSEGALLGPSLMPGGSAAAWGLIRGLFLAISAKTDDGLPCCAWLGPEGSGHFVKMAHNGIEYGIMQCIAELYDVMNRLLRMSPDEIADLLENLGRGELQSYLLDVTVRVLRARDSDGSPMILKIRDRASSKGTGRDSTVAALELGIPATVIAEAMFSRLLSCMDSERAACVAHDSAVGDFSGDSGALLDTIADALYCAQRIGCFQGLCLIDRASVEYGWNIPLSLIPRIWQKGCIIQSAMMRELAGLPDNSGMPEFGEALLRNREFRSRSAGLRHVVATAASCGIPAPGLSSALAFYDSLRSPVLPACLIQAQRDCFGAHGFERSDSPEGVLFHHDWC